jgi:uncharacterized protein (TIGR02996 family)
MTDEPALLAAIAARPDDDTPRLVYADWLDDHGAAERAEFIRVQCVLARDHEDDPAAAERADELENQHRIRWLAGVPTGPGLRWEFRRGFPERLEADFPVLLDRFDRVAAVPWLRALWLIGLENERSREFAARAWPANLVDLELWIEDGANTVRAILAIVGSPQAARLRVLSITQSPLTEEVVTALARSPHLDGLERLILSAHRRLSQYRPLRARFRGRLVEERD